jgi:predicted ATPase/class 3 adenylate cyclase
MRGMLTLLFTDIQGSTQMLDRLGDRYADLLSEHHRVMREAIAAGGGNEVDTAGDSFFVVFPQAIQAVECARTAQLGLSAGEWPDGKAPPVRMGIHTGAPEVRDGNFVGMDVHRAARVMSVAHGGQVLLTGEALQALSAPVEVRDLGYHRLKDLPEPEHLFQVLAPGLEAEFPKLRSLNRSNLPIPANPLVGRRAELERALELLAGPDLRLLTLVGAGGSGKTRLAVEIAGEAVTRYRDGVWIVLLAQITDRPLMLSEIARVLGVDPIAGEPLETTLVGALAGRELLLVLDNFEHLLEAAEIVAQLLAGAPKLDVMTTSREALRISSEHLMEIPPLPPTDAGELFLQRALAVRPDLGIDEEDRAAIEQICARLDGLPLALELAAARIAVFGPRALENRLAERLALPEGPRDLPERQRTLRATIDWSYRLLEPEQRQLFASLAPFLGGVRLDSAEALWGAEAVDGLISLAAKSLLRRREDPDQEPRFWMLETVREFALEQATERADEYAERHAEHFAWLARDAAPHLTAVDQGPWLDRLESELPNLRAALDRLARAAPELALRMAADLYWLWDVRGYPVEGLRRLLEVLSVDARDAGDRARALFGAGRLSLIAGEYAAAVPLLTESATTAHDAGESRVAVNALSNLSWSYQALGDAAAYVAATEDAIALARAGDDEWALALALNNHGDQFSMAGEFDRARPLLEEALELRRGGEPRAIALTASNLAQVTLGAGELETTDALVAEALEHARRINYHPMLIMLPAVGALVALHHDDPAGARTRLVEAIPSLPHDPDAESGAVFLAAAATLAAISGDGLRAATLWGAGDAALSGLHRVETPGASALRARWLPRARDLIAGAAAWEAAYAHGARMAVQDALELAAAGV